MAQCPTSHHVPTTIAKEKSGTFRPRSSVIAALSLPGGKGALLAIATFTSTDLVGVGGIRFQVAEGDVMVPGTSANVLRAMSANTASHEPHVGRSGLIGVPVDGRGIR